MNAVSSNQVELNGQIDRRDQIENRVEVVELVEDQHHLDDEIRYPDQRFPIQSLKPAEDVSKSGKLSLDKILLEDRFLKILNIIK